ncbi:hypothetical protein D3C75_1180020 [compost metagenome]
MIEILAFAERTVSQVIPQFVIGLGALEHFPEVFGVALGVEFFQAYEAPGQCRRLRALGRMPVQWAVHGWLLWLTAVCGTE